jgi:hypothetical protein
MLIEVEGLFFFPFLRWLSEVAGLRNKGHPLAGITGVLMILVPSCLLLSPQALYEVMPEALFALMLL